MPSILRQRPKAAKGEGHTHRGLLPFNKRVHFAEPARGQLIPDRQAAFVDVDNLLKWLWTIKEHCAV